MLFHYGLRKRRLHHERQKSLQGDSGSGLVAFSPVSKRGALFGVAAFIQHSCFVFRIFGAEYLFIYLFIVAARRQESGGNICTRGEIDQSWQRKTALTPRRNNPRRGEPGKPSSHGSENDDTTKVVKTSDICVSAGVWQSVYRLRQAMA